MSIQLFFIILFSKLFLTRWNAHLASNPKGISIVENHKDSITLPLCSLFLHGADRTTIHDDTLLNRGQHLVLLTKNNIFYVYKKKGNECHLLFTDTIAYTHKPLYVTEHGNPIQLMDLDGDAFKEILIGIDKIKNLYWFNGYSLENHPNGLVVKKIHRFQDIINPEYDSQTGFVRSLWGDKGIEVEEYYQFNKKNQMIFVKGTEFRGEVEKNYTQKAGW